MWKVLIADASEQWREALETAMGQDYYVRTSPDGPRTLELAEQFEPDVLIMDLMLSGTDGLSVLKALEQRTPRPRIIITGRYFSNFMTTALERYQVDDVLLKPCDIQAVTGRVAEVLAQEDHLLGLKSIIYPELNHKEKDSVPQISGFRLIESRPVRFTFTVEGEQVQNLLSMTPHMYRISKAGAEALRATEALNDTASCVLNIYRPILKGDAL